MWGLDLLVLLAGPNRRVGGGRLRAALRLGSRDTKSRGRARAIA